MVPKVDIKYDPRFSLEENWVCCTTAIQEAQERGVLATPLTVFNEEGRLVGWLLHGWEPPPAFYTYRPPT